MERASRLCCAVQVQWFDYLSVPPVVNLHVAPPSTNHTSSQNRGIDDPSNRKNSSMVSNKLLYIPLVKARAHATPQSPNPPAAQRVPDPVQPLYQQQQEPVHWPVAAVFPSHQLSSSYT